VANNLNTDAMYYHLADWPEAFEALHQATRALALKQIDTYRKAGYDYLFYCVSGTEWLSPGFFREHILEDTREILTRWRGDGGFTLWHACGQVARLIEAGYYNALHPEILETLSEPPVGNLPSLRWARERLDPAIATKGNIPLNVLLLEDEEAVRAEVQRVREETRGYRHIVGLSDDLLHNTPLRNARAFVEEARRG
jgi:uroporphyrinogen-III decarboxylase